MTYFSRWQPPENENALTALTFGFLRHAPVEHALSAWLTEVLGRPIVAEPIEPTDFWPRYQSIVQGSEWTEPELVFVVDDGQPLTIIVEAKPGYGQQYREQITREVIDTAHEERSRRVACIMVGADLGPPMALEEWTSHVTGALADHGLETVTCEIHYASWASLGAAALKCGEKAPPWLAYANDVVEQLRLNVLMGYDGAPVLDDLEGGLTLANATEAFNRTVSAIRQFYLALHTTSGFIATGLEPYAGGHRILRDGLSASPSAPPEFFETTVFLSLYRKASWASDQVVFVAFDLDSEDEPELQAGAGSVTKDGETMVYRWAHAEEPDGELSNPTLQANSKDQFPDAVLYGTEAEWIFDHQSWVSRRPDADIAWTVGKLAAACSVWDSTAPAL